VFKPKKIGNSRFDTIKTYQIQVFTEKNKIGRRRFLSVTGSALAGIFGILWWDSVNMHRKHIARKYEIRIRSQLQEGFTFLGPVIAHRKEGETVFLWSSCTHMGCTITKEEHGFLVCPCHGSKYDSNGTVVRGPAVEPLKHAGAYLDSDRGEYVISYGS
jgi:Rieske Fe-S protein